MKYQSFKQLTQLNYLSKINTVQEEASWIGTWSLRSNSLNYIISFVLLFLSSQFFSLSVSYKFFSITVHGKNFFLLMFFYEKIISFYLESTRRIALIVHWFSVQNPCWKELRSSLSQSNCRIVWSTMSLEVICWSSLLFAHRYLSETRRNSVTHFQ